MGDYPLAERKLVYRILHGQLLDHPALMDGQFLLDLQRDLQGAARGDGVDVADHGAWDEWLGNVATPCDVRMQQRRVIG